MAGLRHFNTGLPFSEMEATIRPYFARLKMKEIWECEAKLAATSRTPSIAGRAGADIEKEEECVDPKQAASILIFFSKQFFFLKLTMVEWDLSGFGNNKRKQNLFRLSSLLVLVFSWDLLMKRKILNLFCFFFPGGCFGRRKKLQYFYQRSTVI